jgi:hypothetical protein
MACAGCGFAAAPDFAFCPKCNPLERARPQVEARLTSRRVLW